MRSEKIFNLASASAAAATIIKQGNGVGGVHEHDARTNEQVPKIEARSKQRDKSYLDRSCNFLQSQQLTKREGREGSPSEQSSQCAKLETAGKERRVALSIL